MWARCARSMWQSVASAKHTQEVRFVFMEARLVIEVHFSGIDHSLTFLNVSLTFLDVTRSEAAG